MTAQGFLLSDNLLNLAQYARSGRHCSPTILGAGACFSVGISTGD